MARRETIDENNSDRFDFITALAQLIDSTIYEILNIFKLDLASEQVLAESPPLGHIGIMVNLYKKSKGLIFLSIGPRIQVSQAIEAQKYVSPDRLNFSTSLVQALYTYTRTREDQNECSLETSDLQKMALNRFRPTYGAKTCKREPTLVNGRDFDVRRDLFGTSTICDLQQPLILFG
ncbi:hypothetical protein GGS26DRAFT_591444 [Hypomontagnella submonticulosa]|nr:hypothetical protein GGS26DRAFT_591444 [Hypomontagnella submonticulosa]